MSVILFTCSRGNSSVLKNNQENFILTAGSRPAIPAYASACGIIVKPTVMPATKSPIASSLEYLNGRKKNVWIYMHLNFRAKIVQVRPKFSVLKLTLATNCKLEIVCTAFSFGMQFLIWLLAMAYMIWNLHILYRHRLILKCMNINDQLSHVIINR